VIFQIALSTAAAQPAKPRQHHGLAMLTIVFMEVFLYGGVTGVNKDE
jgi:hypothetical protein